MAVCPLAKIAKEIITHRLGTNISVVTVVEFHSEAGEFQ